MDHHDLRRFHQSGRELHLQKLKLDAVQDVDGAEAFSDPVKFEYGS